MWHDMTLNILHHTMDVIWFRKVSRDACHLDGYHVRACLSSDSSCLVCTDMSTEQSCLVASENPRRVYRINREQDSRKKKTKTGPVLYPQGPEGGKLSRSYLDQPRSDVMEDSMFLETQNKWTKKKIFQIPQ